MIERMIGVRAEFDGLRIRPAAPAAWQQYRARKRFRGLDFRFDFDRVGGRSQVKSVTVHGKPLAPVNGAYRIPLMGLRAGRPIEVHVIGGGERAARR
jgi:cellobiose phosphorylase